MEKELHTSSILIVDDNIKNLQVLGTFLKNDGLSVEFARNGQSALVWISRKKFDLVLLDIMMPEMDGFQVCTELKNNPVTSDIPIIFITAKTDTESIIRSFSIGAVDYITKPFIKSELLARIRTHLSAINSKKKIIEYLNKIEERNKDINSSILYARNIQRAVLSSSDLDKKLLPDHFILNCPKDILSGDFYWSNVIDENVIFAVMDCTGHGVPGALMSILGITFLNESILHERILQPELILESLRRRLILSLGQNQDVIDVKDSIEGSIISYNKFTGDLKFAGTLNPIYHIHDHSLNEIKGDRIPIGFYEKETTYSSKTIKIEEGDLIYLFSDGYNDQFGGPDNKKITSRSFKEFVLKIHDFSLETQKKFFKEYLNSWKGDLAQTDDILLIGIRF